MISDGNETRQRARPCRLISLRPDYRSVHRDCLRRPLTAVTHTCTHIHTREGQHPRSPRRSIVSPTAFRDENVKRLLNREIFKRPKRRGVAARGGASSDARVSEGRGPGMGAHGGVWMQRGGREDSGGFRGGRCGGRWVGWWLVRLVARTKAGGMRAQPRSPARPVGNRNHTVYDAGGGVYFRATGPSLLFTLFCLLYIKYVVSRSVGCRSGGGS